MINKIVPCCILRFTLRLFTLSGKNAIRLSFERIQFPFWGKTMFTRTSYIEEKKVWRYSKYRDYTFILWKCRMQNSMSTSRPKV